MMIGAENRSVIHFGMIRSVVTFADSDDHFSDSSVESNQTSSYPSAIWNL